MNKNVVNIMVNLNSNLTTRNDIRIITEFIRTLDKTQEILKRIEERRARNFYEIGNILRNLRNIDYENNNINYENMEDIKIVLSNEEFENIENIKCLNESKCSICLEDIAKNEKIKKINCNHEFHIECLKEWLCRQSIKCPICRFDVRC